MNRWIVFFVFFGACGTISVRDASEDVSVDAVGGLEISSAAAPSQTSAALTGELEDKDHDDFPAWIDCDDDDPDIYPGAYEYCDFRDNDCDGETDEVWKTLWDGLYGTPCSTTDENNCVSVGIWTCDMDRDWLVCSASPITSHVEKCNGLDDDCNGITDIDRWVDLGKPCTADVDGCVVTGIWQCDSYDETAHCSAEYLLMPSPCTEI
ncbi:MAG: MopE-related protein [Candidatus Magasanikbacteria bacterium]|nr:MopE-related protein [Candidatus Magasanikbacteria bacterium]